MEFLKWYGEEFRKKESTGKPLYELKINTVVMQNNVDAISGIGEIIKKLIPAEAGVQLKVVQFQPRGRGKSNKDSLAISGKQFDAVVEETKKVCGDDVSVSARKYLGDKYQFIVIGFNGEAVIPEGEKQEVLSVNQRSINVLNESFCDNLKNYIELNPGFLEQSRNNNTYIQ